MKMKRITAAALAVVLAASAPFARVLNSILSVTASAEETQTDGDWEYVVNGDGETVTLSKYNGTDTKVTIPATLGGKSVTKIGMNAFGDCTSLKSVTIPNSVTAIGYCAFVGCNSLESVTIPESVTEIKEVAFASCTSLKSVTIPKA